MKGKCGWVGMWGRQGGDLGRWEGGFVRGGPSVTPNPLFNNEGTGKASGVEALKPRDFSRGHVRK